MTKPKGRPKVKVARGKPWPPRVRKKALELLGSTHNVTETRKLLAEAYEFVDGDPPARSTLQAWARRADIELDVDALKTRDTTAATEARLLRLEEGREQLSERLLEKLTRPAVDLIQGRLEEAAEVDQVINAAREVYLDALKMIPAARELEQADEANRGAVAGAWEAVKLAGAELKAVLGLRIEVRDLVGIVTRGLGDHLALEGLGNDEDDRTRGDLIVELSVPRPDRAKADAEAVPQSKLRVIEGGR